MIGTIVNTCTIIAGSLLGALLNRGIKEKYKEVLYTGLGLASLAIGLNATISYLPKSEYPVLFILSLAIGGVCGTKLDIDGRFKRLVNKRSKEGNANKLGDGLSTAILLYCIGPLSMLGPVISALKGDHTFLFTNATLDFGRNKQHSHQRWFDVGTADSRRTDDYWQRTGTAEPKGLQNAEPIARAVGPRRVVSCTFALTFRR